MIIFSMDAGASRTRGVLFADDGMILARDEIHGTSLSRTDQDMPKAITGFISAMALNINLTPKDIDHVCLAVAGVSNLDARERLFKELDGLGLADRTLVASDVEAAYEATWGDREGIMACVGTGAIGWAKDAEGTSYRTLALGPQAGGDPGSGYWMGKTLLVQLIVNESSDEDEIVALRDAVTAYFGAATFEAAAQIAGDAVDRVFLVAGLGKLICQFAENSNALALNIVQEGSQKFGDELIQMIQNAQFPTDSVTIGMHGSVIRNSRFFRNLLHEALIYDFQEVEWIEPTIDPVFGAVLIGARLNARPIRIDELKANWESWDVSTKS